MSKPGASKIAAIRSYLLPFLRTHADHHSGPNLRPEHLDRRTVILNKWWTGTIEMLNGKHGESVSGSDRPAVLEAATALMTRPEWTALPVKTTKTTRNPLRSRSTTSLGSNMSDFLADSVYQNVRNLFTQNLLGQMGYVVNKMSMRHGAASVVSFCGKATAYAFFYCEGVADVLIRLWHIPIKKIRQITSQTKSQTRTSKANDTEWITAAFPGHLHTLSFKDMNSMVFYLRTRPRPPVAVSKIPWQGPWVGRWAGKDTDLFYIFLKVYVELASRLLPDDVTEERKMAVPAWPVVQAQLLTTLERSLWQSDPPQPAPRSPRPLPVTFDTIVGEAEASAPIVSSDSAASYRSTAEDRLIMLSRDCLSNAKIMDPKAQGIFAESINSILKAAASAIPNVENDVCFRLCDFLEEAIPILNRYYLASGPAAVGFDWLFWLKAFQRMFESHSSLTKIRVLAFLFSLWGPLTQETERRIMLSCGWLLSQQIFHEHFNHWCPMVRAYYMRLLIWRLGRFDVMSDEVNQ